VTTFPPGVPVRVSALADDTAAAVVAVTVRAGLADVLAWLGENAPDMRTPAELAADLRAAGVVEIPLAEVCAVHGAVRWMRVREEGPCVWCGRWTVRYRQVGALTPVACGPSHADRAKRQAKPRPVVPAQSRVDAARTEEERVRLCPWPGKVVYRSQAAAWMALDRQAADRPQMLTNEAYRCRCGSWHLGRRPTRAGKAAR
jgi:hypothetical protein